MRVVCWMRLGSRFEARLGLHSMALGAVHVFLRFMQCLQCQAITGRHDCLASAPDAILRFADCFQGCKTSLAIVGHNKHPKESLAHCCITCSPGSPRNYIPTQHAKRSVR